VLDQIDRHGGVEPRVAERSLGSTANDAASVDRIAGPCHAGGIVEVLELLPDRFVVIGNDLVDWPAEPAALVAWLRVGAPVRAG
jgi:hypothetical protein